MFRRLFLDEFAPSSAAQALWKNSVLRLILISGLTLAVLIALHRSLDAIGGAAIVAIVVCWCALLGTTATRYQKIRSAQAVSHAQYREFFEPKNRS